jgi:hypothetical protein
MHVPWQEYGRLFICILIKGEIWGHTTSLTPPTFVLYAFNKPGKWAVMYLCVRGINFASLYDFDISFGIVPTVFFHIPSPFIIYSTLPVLKGLILNFEGQLPTLPGHLSSPPVFSGVHVTRSLVLCVYFVDRFYVVASQHTIFCMHHLTSI